jgi:hypothetical protein
VIVTGQQPAVGGGPLYTLVKVAHAMALGRARGEEVLFWCASEDHDLGEAGHADVLRRDGSIQRFTADLGPGRASLRFRAADAWWSGLLAHLRTHLGPGPGEGFLLSTAPQPGEGMGRWQARLLAALFPGLKVAEAHELRPRWGEAMQRALDAWPVAALAELRAELLAGGAADAFGALDEAPLFHDVASGRRAVTSAEARALPLVELSPGAALRPILQQAALSCTTYVGGPGELAYHRFLTPLYGALGVTRPELVPRVSLTLVPSWLGRGVTVADDAVLPLAETSVPAETPDVRLAALDAAIVGLSADSQLAGSLRRLAGERAHLARRLQRLAQRRAGRLSLGVANAYLLPRGQRQERTLSLCQALWEHGPGIAGVLQAAAAQRQPGQHAFIRL